MPLFSFEGRAPQVSPEAWIAPTATLVGDVRVEAQASVWYGAVLRADFGPIIVRRGANIQDGSVLHGGDDPVTEVGEGATVGHLCVVHGCVVHAEALIGNGRAAGNGHRGRHARPGRAGAGRRGGQRTGQGVGGHQSRHLP
jgi:carbonic anhydrase/acetyltransferase-like protein (isoleucine patch superfamily)